MHRVSFKRNTRVGRLLLILRMFIERYTQTLIQNPRMCRLKTAGFSKERKFDRDLAYSLLNVKK